MTGANGVQHHLRHGQNQYAPMQGVLPLRQAITGKFEHFHGRRYDPDSEVTVTSGGTEAIFARSWTCRIRSMTAVSLRLARLLCPSRRPARRACRRK